MKTRRSNKPSQGFYVAVGCPGCGGKLSIESDFFVTICSHCGSPLRLQLPDVPPAYLIPNRLSRSRARFKVDRFLKSGGLPLTGSPLHFKYLYYPYWKIEAMLLRCRNKKQEVVRLLNEESGTETVEYKKTRKIYLSPYSTTVAAGEYFDGVPDSAGIRGQALHAEPFAASRIEEGFDTLKVGRSLQEVVKTIELSLSRMNTIQLADFGQNLTKIYNPKSSLLFFPFCIVEDYSGDGFRRYVLDGLTGKVLSSHDSNEPEDNNAESEKPAASSRSFLTRPITGPFDTNSELSVPAGNVSEKRLNLGQAAVGEDGETPEVQFGQLEVTFHRCHTCGTDLPPHQSCFYICNNCRALTCLDKRVTTVPGIMAAESLDSDARMFPFWRYSIGDEVAARIEKCFGGISKPDWFTVPAFKISNFEAMYRLCRRITNGLSSFELAPVEDLDGRFHPVDVTPSAGIALANVIYFRQWLDRFEQLPADDLRLNQNKVTLCYLPFKLQNYFFVDCVLKGISFEKNVLE